MTALEAYHMQANDCARLLDVVIQELELMSEAANKDRRNWGFHGSATHVRAQLLNVVVFLSGMDEEMINETLAEQREG